MAKFFFYFSFTQNCIKHIFEVTGMLKLVFFLYFFVWEKKICAEVLRPSQPNGVMSSVVSLSNHTFSGQAKSSKWLTKIVHILPPETDNCPS